MAVNASPRYDGVALFREPDLLALGALANVVREQRHGDRTYFNKNLRIELTNVCVASCLFCSFAKLEEGAPGARTLTLLAYQCSPSGRRSVISSVLTEQRGSSPARWRSVLVQ